ncbi:MAG: hypothetical protein JWO46_1767 [Nocardioidaceae bacterium]|nr:hypothetical protein [Nocardioidaceae bacterium]
MVSIDMLAAVHHPVRRRIIDHLVIHGPAQVGTLATAFGEQVGSISHHLRMLQRVGVVEPAPELATDRRASWWRYAKLSISWSADDFAEKPAELHRARVAEKLNVEHQFGKLVAWKKRSERMTARWRRAAFSTDTLAKATPEELSDLCDRVVATVREWKTEIDTDDGQEREPVFVFAHGFPSLP